MILFKNGNKTIFSTLNIKQIIVLLYLVIFQSNGFCNQNNDINDKHEISVNAGYYSLSSIDELYSSQKYSGGNVFIGASFNYKTARYIHSLSLGFAKVNRKPDQISISDKLIVSEERYREISSKLFNLDYSVMRKMYSKHLNVYLTGSLLNGINNSENASLEIYYSSLAVGLYLNYCSIQHDFSFNISVPLISLVSREAYHISSAQNMDEKNDLERVFDNASLKPFGKTFILYTGFSYAYSISRYLELKASYNFRFIYDKTPRPLKSVSGIYSLGLIYKF